VDFKAVNRETQKNGEEALCMVFIELEKVYDAVPKEMLRFRTLTKKRSAERRSEYEDGGFVRSDRGLECRSKGSVLSAYLFPPVTDEIIRDICIQDEVQRRVL